MKFSRDNSRTQRENHQRKSHHAGCKPINIGCYFPSGYVLTSEKDTVFIRQATGLVRGFSHLDLFVQSISIMQIGISTVFTLEAVGTFFPGTNIFALLIIAAVVAIGFAVAWSMMAAAIPRSGGDYVWITRILSRAPSVGFMYSLSYGLAYAIMFNMGFQVWLFTNGILSPTFAGMGLVYNNSALTNLGNWMASGNGLFVTGLILIALAIGTVSFGTRRSSRIINYLFFFSLLITVLWIILGFAFRAPTFKAAYDAQFGTGQYENVFSLAQKSGFSGFTFNLSTTLLVGFSIGYFSTYSNFQYPLWASGEIKKVQKVLSPYVISIVLTAILFVGLFAALYNLMGANWVGAMSVAASSSSTAGSLPFSVAPTFTFFLTILFKSNPILVFLINAGLVAGSFTWFVVPYIAFSRLILGMSFDRVLPKAFGDVNERFRFPFKALVLSVALVILYFSQYAYGLFWNPNLISLSTVFSSFAAVAPAAWTVAALVFALFPWLNRDLYERTMPSQFKKKFGLPLITWVGGFVAVTQALATFTYVTLAAPSPIISFSAVLITMLGSFVLYYVISAYRKRQGLDLKYVFKEIPPE